MTTAGIILIRTHLNGTGALFWLGNALTASGLWLLAAAFGNYKGATAQEIERVTGLQFRKSHFMVTLGYLEMEGERDGNKVILRKTDGASKSAYTSELIFMITGQAEAGFSLAIYPEGFTRRPFGFFPPALSDRPGWAKQHGLVVRGKPGGEAGAGAERIWRTASATLPVKELRLLKISGREMRAEFVKMEEPYEPEEVKRLLDLCLRIYQSST